MIHKRMCEEKSQQTKTYVRFNKQRNHNERKETYGVFRWDTVSDTATALGWRAQRVAASACASVLARALASVAASVGASASAPVWLWVFAWALAPVFAWVSAPVSAWASRAVVSGSTSASHILRRHRHHRRPGP